MQFKLSCIQTSSQSDMAANILHVGKMVTEASAKGAHCIMLPENVFYMRDPAQQPPVFEETAHPGVQAAREWASQHGLWLLVGSVALVVPGSDKFANRSLLINPEGEIAARYDKIHLFDVEVSPTETHRESDRILHGERAVLADTPWGVMGLSICYDVRFPQLYRTLAKEGAIFLSVPAAFTAITGKAHWHTLLRARAIENGCFVFAPAQWGRHAGGRETYGHSLIVDPWGEVLADGGAGEGIITVTIDPSRVHKVRRMIPSLLHDREFNS